MNIINRVDTEPEVYGGGGGAVLQECERNKKCEKCGGISFYEYGERKVFVKCVILGCVLSCHSTTP
jgi:hypothetical protein